jgi:hypothetical protein
VGVGRQRPHQQQQCDGSYSFRQRVQGRFLWSMQQLLLVVVVGGMMRPLVPMVWRLYGSYLSPWVGALVQAMLRGWGGQLAPQQRDHHYHHQQQQQQVQQSSQVLWATLLAAARGRAQRPQAAAAAIPGWMLALEGGWVLLVGRQGYHTFMEPCCHQHQQDPSREGLPHTSPSGSRVGVQQPCEAAPHPGAAALYRRVVSLHISTIVCWCW